MQQKTLYERNFSAVPPLQNASKMEYRLLAEPESGTYGIELLHWFGEEEPRACQAILSETEDAVLKILLILYENAVTEVSGLAVASDLLCRLEEDQEEG